MVWSREQWWGEAGIAQAPRDRDSLLLSKQDPGWVMGTCWDTRGGHAPFPCRASSPAQQPARQGGSRLLGAVPQGCLLWPHRVAHSWGDWLCPVQPVCCVSRQRWPGSSYHLRARRGTARALRSYVLHGKFLLGLSCFPTGSPYHTYLISISSLVFSSFLPPASSIRGLPRWDFACDILNGQANGLSSR